MNAKSNNSSEYKRIMDALMRDVLEQKKRFKSIEQKQINHYCDKELITDSFDPMDSKCELVTFDEEEWEAEERMGCEDFTNYNDYRSVDGDLDELRGFSL